MLRLIGFILMMSTAGVRGDDLPFRVVVHRSSAIESISRAELSAIFLKRTKSWTPVDKPATSRVREEFSRAIHGKSVAYVTRYWQRLLFSGRALPPRQLPNDAAVLAFVRTNRNAIGYIDHDTPPGDGVKVIAVTP